MPRPCLGTAVLLALAPMVEAGQSPQGCAQLRNRDARLDCYDAVFGKPVDEVSPAIAASPTASTTGNFGLTQQQIDRSTAEVGAGNPESISTTVASLARGRDGKFTVTLANGQAWVQSEIDSRARMAVGDAVTIRRAALGSYLLVTTGGIATRVKRVD